MFNFQMPGIDQSQSFLPVESIETFNTEKLMASTQDRKFNIPIS